MVTPFELVIRNMQRLGFFQFLFPWMLSSAVFYGLLRKSAIFGEPEKNVAVNAVVSVIAAFMVWSYPILSGVSIEQELSAFFMHGMSVTLVVMLGLSITSMFLPPDLPKQLTEKIFKTAGPWSIILVAGILLGLVVLVSSGLFNIFTPVFLQIPQDVLTTIGVLILMLITVIIIAFPTGRAKT